MRSAWFGLLVISTAAAAQTPAPLPVDTIVGRYLAARGGADRIRNTKEIRMVGHMEFGQGANGIDTIEMARPGRIRTAVHLAEGTLIQAYDGRTVWGTYPGDSGPHALDTGTAKNVIAGGDMDGPLLDYRARGIQVTLIGPDTAQGKPAWALRVIRPDSTVDTYFIDAASYELTRWQGNRVADGLPVIYETYFSDYRRYGGMLFPCRLESHTLNRPGSQLIIVDSVAVDLPVSDQRFKLPNSH
ncbi:MAG TPA: hypothetical protein VEV39_04075 [Gemmatimonadales bacterium]|nr:hypothetical protein [Gemmatimonadales bacterium]